MVPEQSPDFWQTTAQDLLPALSETHSAPEEQQVVPQDWAAAQQAFAMQESPAAQQVPLHSAVEHADPELLPELELLPEPELLLEPELPALEVLPPPQAARVETTMTDRIFVTERSQYWGLTMLIGRPKLSLR